MLPKQSAIGSNISALFLHFFSPLNFAYLFNFKPEVVCKPENGQLAQNVETLLLQAFYPNPTPQVPLGHTQKGALSVAVLTFAALWPILLLALGKSPNLLVLRFFPSVTACPWGLGWAWDQWKEGRSEQGTTSAQSHQSLLFLLHA